MEYQRRSAEGTVISDGATVKPVSTKGLLSASPLFTEARTVAYKRKH